MCNGNCVFNSTIDSNTNSNTNSNSNTNISLLALEAFWHRGVHRLELGHT